MFLTLFKSKIHRATVTGLELAYEGSIAIDENLLEAADILPGEQVQVLNLQNGERFITYAIRGKRGSGQMTAYVLPQEGEPQLYERDFYELPDA